MVSIHEYKVNTKFSPLHLERWRYQEQVSEQENHAFSRNSQEHSLNNTNTMQNYTQEESCNVNYRRYYLSKECDDIILEYASLTQIIQISCSIKRQNETIYELSMHYD